MITVKDLSFTYPGSKKPAVDGISFSVGKGEIFGFLGPSGAGKSTTQHIVIGLLRTYKGSAAVRDVEVRTCTRNLYEHIGVSFELPNLYTKFTALENLKFFSALYERPCRNPMELLEQVGLKEEAHKRVSDFSKGMSMRLNFCRALLHDPEMLFLDEPTSGLDPSYARVIKEMILQERDRGKTIFLTTHNMHTADELCDRVAFLVDGRIALLDAPRNIRMAYGSSHVRIEYRSEGVLHQQSFPLEGMGRNRDLLDLLEQEQVETIHSQEASLEDVFIQVTGRTLG